MVAKVGSDLSERLPCSIYTPMAQVFADSDVGEWMRNGDVGDDPCGVCNHMRDGVEILHLAGRKTEDRCAVQGAVAAGLPTGVGSPIVRRISDHLWWQRFPL